ncbi:MAG TPA: STAS domain-containing protein [Candidatus Limnocylindrales bacterium]|nr:STAS domain-containing protein [Candidatus Limnocylindrales bacterium]
MPDAYEIATPRLTLHTETRENEMIVRCSGVLTSSNAFLLKTHSKALLAQTKHLVLDLTDLAQMDSSGLGVIVAIYISSRNAGATLDMINLSARIREIFSLANLLSVFETCGRYGTRLP